MARGIVVLAILGLLAYVALRAPSGIPGFGYRYAYVSVPNVGDLQAHDDVRIAGVRVGQVLSEQAQAGGVRIKIQFATNVGSVPSDSTVVVRSSGLLGQRYLQVIPGPSHQPVPSGGTLHAAANSLTLGIPEALQLFDTQTRGALGQAVRGLGAGLVGRGPQLNDAIAVAPQAATDFRTTASAILSRPQAAGTLVPALDSAAAALNGSKDQLTEVLSPANKALQPFVDQRGAVQRTLAQAPAALTTASTALGESLALLASVRQLAGAVNHTLPPAPSALRATSALLQDSPPSLKLATALLGRAVTAVPATLRITHALPPVLQRLKEPLVNLLAPVQTLTAHDCDIVNFAHNWASFLGFGIASGGGGGKIGPLGEIRATALLAQPFAESGALTPTTSTIVANPYPKPCLYSNSVYSLLNPMP